MVTKKEITNILKNERINYPTNLKKSELIQWCKNNLDKYDWFYITRDYVLSEDFIKEFKDYVDWYCVSNFRKLSESFLKKFKDDVYWDDILENQTLSKGFLNKFKQLGYIK